MILLCANRTRRTRFVSFSAAIAFLTAGVTATLADFGIAARYHKNIASDPAVIFADDFESYTSPSQLTTKWDGAYQLPNIRIATRSGTLFRRQQVTRVFPADKHRRGVQLAEEAPQPRAGTPCSSEHIQSLMRDIRLTHQITTA